MGTQLDPTSSNDELGRGSTPGVFCGRAVCACVWEIIVAACCRSVGIFVLNVFDFVYDALHNAASKLSRVRVHVRRLDAPDTALNYSHVQLTLESTNVGVLHALVTF